MKFFSTWERVKAAYPDKEVRWQGGDDASKAFQDGGRSFTARVCEHPPATMRVSEDAELKFGCTVCGERFADKKKEARKSITVRLFREGT